MSKANTDRIFTASRAIFTDLNIDGGKVSEFRMSDSRAPSWIGSAQGDHVSAYALFIECVSTAIDGLPIDDALNRTMQIIDSYASRGDAGKAMLDTQKMFDYAKEQVSGPPFISDERMQAITEILRESSHAEAELSTSSAKSLLIHYPVASFFFECWHHSSYTFYR